MAVAFFNPCMYNVEGTGLVTPPNVDDFKATEYPHFHVFLNVHLGQAFDLSTIEANACIIAAIPNEKILEITLRELYKLGVNTVGSNYWD